MAIIIKKRSQIAPAPEPEPLVSVKEKREKKTPNDKPIDGMCMLAISKSLNMYVPWFMMASYLYYIHDLKLISDDLYDSMAKTMLENWDVIEHQHKRFITKEDLAAGTLYALRDADYPNLVKGSASHLVKTNWGIELNITWGRG